MNNLFGFLRLPLLMAARYKYWLRAYSLLGAEDYPQRISAESSTITLVKALLGLLFPIRLPGRSILIVEGSRLCSFLEFRERSNPFIIGSYPERQASLQGKICFLWSFPINSAVQLAAIKRIYWPLRILSCLWAKHLSYKRCLVITYEDTQPIGIFFSELAKVLPNLKHICIQHGYFVPGLPSGFLDNRNSRINFVWDQVQLDLLKNSRCQHYIMGPPCETASAEASSTNCIKLVLVGTGYQSQSPTIYLDFLSLFRRVSDFLDLPAHGIEVVYRPHPSELSSRLYLDRRNWFVNIQQPSDCHLETCRSVYLGSISTLLYEAFLAGHCVGYIRHPGLPDPLFPRDFEVSVDQFSELTTLLVSAINSFDFFSSRSRVCRENCASEPLMARFKMAINQAGLSDCI
jgi:hypothetical protein